MRANKRIGPSAVDELAEEIEKRGPKEPVWWVAPEPWPEYIFCEPKDLPVVVAVCMLDRYTYREEPTQRKGVTAVKVDPVPCGLGEYAFAVAGELVEEFVRVMRKNRLAGWYRQSGTEQREEL